MMKKFIAVLAVSAIATTAAWAQISFEGMVMGRADLANNVVTNHGGGGGPADWSVIPSTPPGSGDPLQARRAFAQEARLFMNMTNHDGTAGAVARFWNLGWQSGQGWNNASGFFHAWAWWRPMENLLLQIGENPWGHFGANQIVAGAFTGNESENSLTGMGSAGAFHYGALFDGMGLLHRNAGFYGGFVHPGITAAFEPIEGLTILLGIPFAIGNAHGTTTAAPTNFIASDFGWVAGMLYSHVGIRYVLEDIGTVSFTWAGGPGWWDDSATGNRESPGPTTPLFGVLADDTLGAFGWGNTGVGSGRFANSSKFYLSFLLSALEDMGMQVNLGVAYTLPFNVDTATGNTYHFPVELGLGFRFDAGDLALRARLAAAFAGTVEDAAGNNNNMPFILGFNVHPTFNLGMFAINLNAGLQLVMNMNDDRGTTGDFFYDNGSDAIFGWHVSPYITVPVMNATVFAGVHIETCGRSGIPDRPTADDGSIFVRWRVPVGLRINF